VPLRWVIQIKPLCDGTARPDRLHDSKDPRSGSRPGSKTYNRPAGEYPRQTAATLPALGFCTDRLATVFHLNDEPSTPASGGRMDEIIRAVRDCPSGALSLVFDGKVAQDEVDYHDSRQAGIEVSKDGPYRVIGGIGLVDDHADDVSRNAGASREHYALWPLRPLAETSRSAAACTGKSNSEDPVTSDDHQTTIFEWAGGCLHSPELTRLFYEKYVPEDPLLRAVVSQPCRPITPSGWRSGSAKCSADRKATARSTAATPACSPKHSGARG